MSIIDKHEENYKSNLKKINEKYKETPEQFKKRQLQNETNLNRIKGKLARQEYDQIVAPPTDHKYSGI